MISDKCSPSRKRRHPLYQPTPAHPIRMTNPSHSMEPTLNSNSWLQSSSTKIACEQNQIFTKDNDIFKQLQKDFYTLRKSFILKLSKNLPQYTNHSNTTDLYLLHFIKNRQTESIHSLILFKDKILFLHTIPQLFGYSIFFCRISTFQLSSRTDYYNHLMATLKSKQSQNYYSNYKPPSQQTNFPTNKPNPLDVIPLITTRQLRSNSRSKSKLKFHLFQNKNQCNEEPLYYQRNRAQITIKTYSSYSALPNQIIKPKINRIPQFLSKKQTNQISKGKTSDLTNKNQQTRKEKREFRLIRQIKKEKLLKIQQKRKQIDNKQLYFDKDKNKIQIGCNQKIQSFAQEMNKILNPSPNNQSPSNRSIQSLQSLQFKIQSQQKEIALKSVEYQLSKLKTQLSQQQQSNSRHKSINLNVISGQYQILPDLSRSFCKVNQLLIQRKESANSSVDITLKESKVRAQISISLALQSKQGSRIKLSEFYKDIQIKEKNKQKIACRDKVNAHLQILHRMSLFVYQSLKFDEIGDQWEELNFLIYKKYYIERRKALNFLQKYPMKNPFCIYSAQISSKQIIQFSKTEQGKATLQDLTIETKLIKQKLTLIYSKFDKGKVGEKINLYEYDNFSHWIIEQLWAQLILTEHNANHNRDVINTRLCRILQLIFLISELSGRFQFSFQEAETAIQENQHANYIKQGKDIFQKYIRYNNDKYQNIL